MMISKLMAQHEFVNIHGLVKRGNAAKLLMLIMLSFSLNVEAQNITLRSKTKNPTSQRKSRPKSVSTQVPSSKKASPRPQRDSVPSSFSQSERDYQRAMEMAEAGQEQNAAIKLYSMLRSPGFKSRETRIRYILGLMLQKMNLPQVASFQFIEVIQKRDPSFLKAAVQNLVRIGEKMGDNTLLNYVAKDIALEDFPASERDGLYYRLGVLRHENGDYDKAIALFSRVSQSSRNFVDAIYYQGLCYLKLGKESKALEVFQSLKAMASSYRVDSPFRVQSQLAVARTYYKNQSWDAAISEYSQVPRDSEYWPQALFEQTWSLLRAGRFRSALSNFHTLHSPFYEDMYNPESLLLRSIVYLYICKYEEAQKVLSLYKRNYSGLSRVMQTAIESGYLGALPKFVQSRLEMDEEVRNLQQYLDFIREERGHIQQNPTLRRSSVGLYGLKVLQGRARATENKVTLRKIEVLQALFSELSQFNEQADLIAFEMTSGKVDQVRKRLASGGLKKSIEERVDRSFYVANGFQYYPFKGEYWRDEVGNFHYMGVQNCE